MKDFRPSAATRWITCPGSHFLQQGESPSNKYAIVGTAAHHLLERMVTAGHSRVTEHQLPIPVLCDVTGVTTHVPVDDEMIDSVNMALEYIYDLTRQFSSWFTLTEKRLEHPTIKGLGGTLDVIIRSGNIMHILDYKHGTSKVKADCDQLATYATIAKANYPELEEITTHIMQPRGRVKEKFRRKDWSTKELAAYEVELQDATETANLVTLDTLNENLKTGGHCWYCSSRKTCPAKLLEQAQKDFS